MDNIKLLYVSYEYLGLIDFVNIVCVTGVYSYYGVAIKAGSILQLNHAFLNFSEWSEELLNRLHKREYGDILATIGPKYTPPKDKIFNVEIVQCGYLGFDNVHKRLFGRSMQRDSVLFAPYCCSEILEMLDYIKSILQEYRVIFRYRENFGGEGKQYIQEFLKYSNFILDEESGFSDESYLRSFCMVCASTSSKNSFPLLTLCPVIVLPHETITTGISVDESIGINCKEFIASPKMLEIINGIYKTLPEWNAKILQYRNENISNFGCASEALADWIVKRLQ